MILFVAEFFSFREKKAGAEPAPLFPRKKEKEHVRFLLSGKVINLVGCVFVDKSPCKAFIHLFLWTNIFRMWTTYTVFGELSTFIHRNFCSCGQFRWTTYDHDDKKSV